MRVVAGADFNDIYIIIYLTWSIANDDQCYNTLKGSLKIRSDQKLLTMLFVFRSLDN